MLKIGEEEVEAVAQVLRSGKLFRYGGLQECERFERDFAAFLGVRHTVLCSSGTAALSAALVGLGIGPGDEVLVPAHTYMASAGAVLAAGAIPVVVDVDESILMDPAAVQEAVGPRTKAIMPVHMWGSVCDMDALLDVARHNNLLVVEDGCQCIGGTYKGRAVGSMGDAAGFSFNFYKNITCGEGGAVSTNDDLVLQRARCFVDPCGFYWEGRNPGFTPFANCGSRISEVQGAILNVQLRRLPGLLVRLREIKARLLDLTKAAGLTLTPRHSPEAECATSLMYLFKAAETAEQFQKEVGGAILLYTGRHTFTEWDAVLHRHGAHHPALNPFDLPENAQCRKEYSTGMNPKSRSILSRTVSLGLNPEMTDDEVEQLAQKIRLAADHLAK